MRWLILVFVVASCGQSGGKSCTYLGHTYASGDEFTAGDGCNTCRCGDGQVSCTKQACVDASVDGAPASCAPSGGCPDGPACGTTCCNTGEQCVQNACRCGSGSPCGVGDLCASNLAGSGVCGFICCGVSGPCPP